MVDRAALADVLDNLKPRFTFATSIGVECLVNTAWILSLASLLNFVIDVASRALATLSVDTIIVLFAFTEHSVDVEELVSAASVAMVVGARCHMGRGLAVMTMRICQGCAQ